MLRRPSMAQQATACHASCSSRSHVLYHNRHQEHTERVAGMRRPSRAVVGCEACVSWGDFIFVFSRRLEQDDQYVRAGLAALIPFAMHTIQAGSVWVSAHACACQPTQPLFNNVLSFKRTRPTAGEHLRRAMCVHLLRCPLSGEARPLSGALLRSAVRCGHGAPVPRQRSDATRHVLNPLAYANATFPHRSRVQVRWQILQQTREVVP